MTVIKTNSHQNLVQCLVCDQWYEFGKDHDCPMVAKIITTTDKTQDKLDKIINLLIEIKEKIK